VSASASLVHTAGLLVVSCASLPSLHNTPGCSLSLVRRSRPSTTPTKMSDVGASNAARLAAAIKETVRCPRSPCPPTHHHHRRRRRRRHLTNGGCTVVAFRCDDRIQVDSVRAMPTPAPKATEGKSAPLATKQPLQLSSKASKNPVAAAMVRATAATTHAPQQPLPLPHTRVTKRLREPCKRLRTRDA
jgi:hypothetical protein